MQLDSLVVIVYSFVELSSCQYILLGLLKYHDLAIYFLDPINFDSNILLIHVKLVPEDRVCNHLSEHHELQRFRILHQISEQFIDL